MECPRCRVVLDKAQETEAAIPDGAPDAGMGGSGAAVAVKRLEAAPGLAIHQIKQKLEIFTGFECKNKYRVLDAGGSELFVALERGEGVGSALIRQFLKNARPFTMQILTPEGDLVLTVKRPFRFWFQKVDVFDARDRQLGSVEMRFSILKKLYTVTLGNGDSCGLIGPLFRPWTFHIDRPGDAQGLIQKKWSGALTELFTDADNFGVTFPVTADTRLKAVLLGAVFLIDQVHFENRN